MICDNLGPIAIGTMFFLMFAVQIFVVRWPTDLFLNLMIHFSRHRPREALKKWEQDTSRNMFGLLLTSLIIIGCLFGAALGKDLFCPAK